jgi:DNA-binding transcriptional regulator YdaS (Cro superfamily)
VGDELALAVRLGITPAKLKSWLDGSEPVPASAFLDAVDIIVGATPTEIARSREALLRPAAVPQPPEQAS